MEKTLLKEYAKLREKIADLEKTEKILKEAIIKDMEKNKLEKLESEFGNFTKAARKVWSYSKKVLKLEEEVKLKKIEEQEKGVAKMSETVYLVFKQNNEE